MEAVILKNGAEEIKSFVVMAMAILNRLAQERPLALCDLVMKCRDRNYQFFGDNEGYLKSLELVEGNGTVHGSIRNIVLSAAEGDGLDMHIRSPVQL